MKAIICTKYGPPEVLQLQDIEKPEPQKNEVLVKVHNTVVSPSDCAFRKGEPFIVRLMYGLKKPRIATLGVEFSGTVEALGKEVTLYRVGDEVFGISVDKFGTTGEYLSIFENKELAIKSPKMSFEDAVGIIDGALTSLVFLRDIAKIEKGQSVLINGASGSVGAYGVQLAKYLGAEVTGVCGSSNVEMVRSLGADKVIDYTKDDFTKRGESYDVIFDAVGKSSFSKCRASLKPQGKYLLTVPTLKIIFQMLWTSILRGKKAVFSATGLRQKKENLVFLRELYDDGKLKSVIDRRYELKDIVEAHVYVETGHKKGNVIINL
jgi:NADPH:quinone reductase-like Zn-dependent oxidoreductase